VITMMLNSIQLDLAHERQQRFIAEAARSRLVESRPSSIRRSIGRRVIAMGQRIAAEPSFELARSR
jgi:hypothetical protein